MAPYRDGGGGSRVPGVLLEQRWRASADEFTDVFWERVAPHLGITRPPSRPRSRTAAARMDSIQIERLERDVRALEQARARIVAIAADFGAADPALEPLGQPTGVSAMTPAGPHSEFHSAVVQALRERVGALDWALVDLNARGVGSDEWWTASFRFRGAPMQVLLGLRAKDESPTDLQAGLWIFRTTIARLAGPFVITRVGEWADLLRWVGLRRVGPKDANGETAFDASFSAKGDGPTIRGLVDGDARRQLLSLRTEPRLTLEASNGQVALTLGGSEKIVGPTLELLHRLHHGRYEPPLLKSTQPREP